MSVRLRYLVFLPLLLALAGCGQKGPLYLPAEPEPAQTPTEPTTKS